MSEVGEFLARVFGSKDPFVTMRATIRQWCDEDLEMQAGYSKRALGHRKAEAHEVLRADRIRESELLVWAQPPDRYRIEQTRSRSSKVEETLEVVNNDRAWRRDHQGHVEVDETRKRRDKHDACPTDIARHFDYRLLREILTALAVEAAGSVQTAGRDCVCLRGIARAGGQLWPHWVPHGADEYELHADRERGVVLYIGGRFQGKLFEVNEVLQVAFDEPLDQGLFAYTSAWGEQVAPATPIVEHLSLERAIATMSFIVLVPSVLPDGFRQLRDVMYHPPRLHAERAHLSLMYSDFAHSQTLFIDECETPDPMIDDLEWEPIEHQGRAMRISDVDESDGYRVVVFEQDGTHVKIWSGIERRLLLDIAASLVPAQERRQ